MREVVAARHTRPAAGIRGAAQQTLVVRETKDLGALLRELGEAAAGHRRRTRRGCTARSVTWEVVLEQLVGDIEDEFDLPDDTIERVDDRTVRAAGTMTVDDVNEAFAPKSTAPASASSMTSPGRRRSAQAGTGAAAAATGASSSAASGVTPATR